MALVCPGCKSENVCVTFLEKGQKTGRRGKGFGGHMNNTARGLTALGTLGISNLFWKKSQGVNYTKTKHVKVALCQSCGYDWEIF